MGKLARTLILSLLFIGVILGIIIANIGWSGVWAYLKPLVVGIEQLLRIPASG